MEPLQPTRPVSVHREKRETAPAWKVWCAYAGGPALHLASIWVTSEGSSR